MERAIIATTVDSEILAMLKRLVIAVSQANLAPEQISDHANLFNDCGLDSTSILDIDRGTGHQPGRGIWRQVQR